MLTITDLTPEIIARVHSYALEDTNADADTVPAGLVHSLLKLSLVNKEWNSIIHSEQSIGSWSLVCQYRFPNSSACTLEDYKHLLSPLAQSSARVIQRFFCKIDCDKATWWRRPLDAPSSPFSIVPCCICGIRYDLRMLNSCWIADCKSEFSVCGVCEDKHPERAMGKAFGVRARVPACFGCKEKGSVCDRKQRGKLMIRVFTSQ